MISIINVVCCPCVPFLLIAFLRDHPKWPRQEHQDKVWTVSLPLAKSDQLLGNGKLTEGPGHLAQQSAEQEGRKSCAVNYRNHCKKEEDNLYTQSDKNGFVGKMENISENLVFLSITCKILIIPIWSIFLTLWHYDHAQLLKFFSH